MTARPDSPLRSRIPSTPILGSSAALLFGVFLAGCATPGKNTKIEAFVTAHAETTPWMAETFQVVPPASFPHQDELQFAELKHGVVSILNEIGLTEAAPDEDPDLIVAFEYGRLGHFKRIHEVVTDVSTAAGSHVLMVTREQRMTDEYKHFARVTAIDGEEARSGLASALWTTTAIGTGECDDPRRVVPMLVSAMAPFMGTTTGKPVTTTCRETDPDVSRIRTAIRTSSIHRPTPETATH